MRVLADETLGPLDFNVLKAIGEGLASGVGHALASPCRVERLTRRPKDIEVHLGREVMPSRRDVGVVCHRRLAIGLVQKVAHALVHLAGKHVAMRHPQKLQSDTFGAQACAIGAVNQTVVGVDLRGWVVE